MHSYKKRKNISLCATILILAMLFLMKGELKSSQHKMWFLDSYHIKLPFLKSARMWICKPPIADCLIWHLKTGIGHLMMLMVVMMMTMFLISEEINGVNKKMKNELVFPSSACDLHLGFHCFWLVLKFC